MKNLQTLIDEDLDGAYESRSDEEYLVLAKFYYETLCKVKMLGKTYDLFAGDLLRHYIDMRHGLTNRMEKSKIKGQIRLFLYEVTTR